MTTGTASFAGTLLLHRDVALTGAADAVMSLGPIVRAGDFAGTGALALGGLAGLRFEGAVPAGTRLDIGGRLLSFGTRAVAASAVSTLSLGSALQAATLEVDFGAGANDSVAVTAPDGLTLSNTLVNLYYAGSGLPFAEPGTYTLFTYSGTLGGDAALLSAGNPQSGASYVFADDSANHRVTLTISGTSGGVGAVWINASSGSWGLGANWDGGLVPNGAGVVPLFGVAITNPATVDVGPGHTAGGLLFNNAGQSYTLSGGGGLTLATNGATPLISILAGTHTINTALNGSDGVNVATASGSALILDSAATVNTDMSLTQGAVELRGHATVGGAAALADATLLRALSTTNAAIGSLSGPASAAVTFAGIAPKLTVNQLAAGTFAGSVSGAADAQLVKAGSDALTLSAPLSPFLGKATVSAGTLALQSTALPAAVDVGASGALSVTAPATNGLAGFFYNVTPNTNAFWTLAGLESHFAALTPDFAMLSGASSNIFDFGVGNTYLFPAPYGTGGSRSTNFEVAWRGTVTLPTSGTYRFGVNCDDGFLLAIDGRQVMARNYYTSAWTEGEITLDAGRYDIVLGYFQQTGGGGIRVRVRPPNETETVALPSAWLSPYAQSGKLSGSGGLSLADAAAQLRTVQASGSAAYAGALSSPAGGLLAKAGSGALNLAGTGAANAFAGDLDVQGGVLTLDANARLAPDATLRVRSGALLAVAGVETAGAVCGDGTLAVGGHAYTVPLKTDADTGLSTAKTYTHLLDFGSSTAYAVINGVSFTKVSGSSGTGYSGAPTGSHPGGNTWNIGVAPSQALYSLLNDFNYGTADGTLTLSGLTAGACYELRLYHRCWEYPKTRSVTFTFDPDGAGPLSDAVTVNIDAVTPNDHCLGYRYVAAGTQLTIRYHANTADTYHLYGLSNEAIAGSPTPALTLAPAAGQNTGFAGPVAGSGQLIKLGAGTQRFGGTNSLPQPLSVQQGTVLLERGASLVQGAAVSAGATLSVPIGSVTLGGLTGEGELNLQGGTRYPTYAEPTFVTFTNDATCGISASKVYTHKLDFGNAGAATVNGVAFTKTNGTYGVVNGYGWTNFPPMSTSGRPESIGLSSANGMYSLLNDFNYNLPAGGTMKLTGLTPGKRYEVRFYNRTWDPAANRTQTFVFDPDGAGPVSHSVTYDFDIPGGVPPTYLGYRYVAATNELLITINRAIGDSYHLYALTNEETEEGVQEATALAIADDQVFGGTVTGSGPLLKTGAGSFAVTGDGTATGPLTVSAGACGVAEGGRITAGPVSVLAGATLFGDGLMGGNVAVASNAWLMAGTSAACGTLAVGGDLTLAPGALLAFRFDAGKVNDTVTVAGTLTFPTDGVVQASALTAGTATPAKALFFASSQVINGPAELTGWTVDGVDNCTLRYSDDRTKIYVFNPRGSLITLH
jgi:fibronectin-binding autotransporter adhesin